ncbi:TPA: 50S ribosomal protein L6 [Candidatus Woesearchaeota archaeon]|nr:50S ribosomal protein L6P [uncultured archaeon]MBS3115343.1 50S ribosomal protein L6 [Candidatus Woesearchaeota archaeon]HIH39183.1 50S ribosomal protein L6 [Candidatus Woesearchaeota archaeon]
MRIPELKQTVSIPEGVSVALHHNKITAKGQHGEISRIWNEPRITVKVENNQVTISSKNATKKQKRIIATTRAQIRNIVNGVKNGNEYKLKVCASHFPMQIAMEGNTIVIKNFFGEKIPRKTNLPKDVQVKIQGDKISVTGPDVEKVGKTASLIEQTCRIANRDRRVFQDGIFLIEKNGKTI